MYILFGSTKVQFCQKEFFLKEFANAKYRNCIKKIHKLHEVKVYFNKEIIDIFKKIIQSYF